MKNQKIEAIFKAQEEIYHKFGNNSKEYSEFINSYKKGVWTVINAYYNSKERGFDEIVFDRNSVVWEQDIPDIIEFCREAKIGWFVYGSTCSGAMETVMCFVEAGAKVGKFVVKEYTDNNCWKEKIVKVPGLRINL